MPMDVLVTDGIMKKSLSVVRCIAPLTTTTGVISSYPVSMAGLSRDTDRHHCAPRSGSADYVDYVNRLVDRYGYDHLIPVGGATTNTLVEHRDRLSSSIDVVLPDSDAMWTAQHKDATVRLASRLDIPVPETVRATPDADLEPVLDCGFPLVVKAPTEAAPRFVEYANSKAEMHRTMTRYREQNGVDPLVQEHLAGEGCGLFALYLDGECAGQYSHRRIREYPPTGGISACAESERNDELASMGTKLLDSLGWNGPAMVEFKRDGEGTPHFLELNPKFWGSIGLGIGSGYDFPSAILQYLETGSRPVFSFTPTRHHWPLSGDLQHAVQRPRAIPAVLSDLLSRDTGSNVVFTDPLPHAVELGKALVSPFLHH